MTGHFIVDAGLLGKWSSLNPNIEYIIELLEDCDAEFEIIPLTSEPQQLELPL